MARIAYVDHSYHQKTASTKFIPNLLVRHGHTVDFFWDDAWQHGSAISWKSVADYDAVIMFQSCIPVYGGYYGQLHPNVTYIPMLDQFGAWCGPLFNLTEFWEPFQGCKVLNFSTALHSMVNAFGIKSKFVRYYQPVLDLPPSPEGALRGFFWLRREDQIPWKTIRTLIEKTNFESFHLHLAADPGTEPATAPSSEDIARFKITVSSWFDDKNSFNQVLDKANVFFAPRAEEGIGQSMLEAFSRGQCVVAPNQGTMNEYILNGINGFLYDLERPEPLNFSKALEMGNTGWHAARAGYQEWLQQEEAIVQFLLTPAADYYLGKYSHFERARHLSRTGRGRRWLRDTVKRLPGGQTVIRFAKKVLHTSESTSTSNK